jgi:hypothetical protein
VQVCLTHHIRSPFLSEKMLSFCLECMQMPLCLPDIPLIGIPPIPQLSPRAYPNAAPKAYCAHKCTAPRAMPITHAISRIPTYRLSLRYTSTPATSLAHPPRPPIANASIPAAAAISSTTTGSFHAATLMLPPLPPPFETCPVCISQTKYIGLHQPATAAVYVRKKSSGSEEHDSGDAFVMRLVDGTCIPGCRYLVKTRGCPPRPQNRST